MRPNNNTIRKYINHKTSEKEEKEILEWLEDSDANVHYLAEKMAEISVHDSFAEREGDRADEKMLARLNARIDAESCTKVSRMRRFGRIAAVCFCAAALLSGIFFMSPPGSEKQDIQELRYSQSNNTGKTLKLVLPDGTKLFLAPGAKIEYDVDRLKDKRIISLDGEAYFDVARDSLRPLFVKTVNIAVKVLGTSFSVRTGATFPNTEVVLERGLVRILSEDGTNMVNLVPDQKAIFNEQESVVLIEDVRAKAYIAQHFNLVRLEEVSFAEIKRELEAHYGVKISPRGRPDNKAKYVFQYSNTDSIEDVLTVLEFISGVRCEIL